MHAEVNNVCVFHFIGLPGAIELRQENVYTKNSVGD